MFLVLLLSGVIVVGSCILHPSSESLQFKSSSTLVLHKACSIKLYSSAAFLILRPQDLQTHPERLSKISPTPPSLPDGKNFSNDALPPREVKFTPQNVYLWFSCSFTNLCGSCWHYTAWRFAMNIFSRLSELSQSCRKARLIPIGYWTDSSVNLITVKQ